MTTTKLLYTNFVCFRLAVSDGGAPLTLLSLGKVGKHVLGVNVYKKAMFNMKSTLKTINKI